MKILVFYGHYPYNPQPPSLPGCTAVRNWAVIRHGTRNPSAKIIRAMNTDLYRFKDQIIRKGRLCDMDRELFKSWESHLSEDEEKNLVAEGEDELIDLAERYQKRLPDLLSDQYDNSTYRVMFTTISSNQYPLNSSFLSVQIYSHRANGTKCQWICNWPLWSRESPPDLVSGSSAQRSDPAFLQALQKLAPEGEEEPRNIHRN